MPATVPGIGPARNVRAGDTATCALLVDESVWCWGSNARGTLGTPDASATADGGVAPVEVLGPGTVSALAMGAFHACVLTIATPTTAAQVMCWGENAAGQAGVVDASVVASPTKVAIANVSDMGASASDTCFSRTGSFVPECICDNVYGELGRGDAGDAGGIDSLPHPVPAPVLLGSLGKLNRFFHSTGNHLGALFTSGQFATWGENNDGQLGPQNDSGAPDPTPALVPLSEVTALSMTQFASCVLRVDGTIWCWGSTADGQTGSTLAMGSVQAQPAQVLCLPVGGATGLTTGLTHVCALMTGGTVACWGFNNFGQLGRTTTAGYDPTPEPVVF